MYVKPSKRDLPLQVSKLFGLGTSEVEELPHAPSVNAVVKQTSL